MPTSSSQAVGTPRNRRPARPVLSCMPCYSKKQKCNRQYPCNHCIHRRKPELCAYHVIQNHVRKPSCDASLGVTEEPINSTVAADTSAGFGSSPSSSAGHGSHGSQVGDPTPTPQLVEPPLAELFGYSEDNSTNLLGILRKFGLEDEEPPRADTEIVLSGQIAKRVQTELCKLPARPILDFLIQYFLKEGNWINQVIYPPVFLRQYKAWCSLPDVTRVADLDFAILILRICAHASQGLSSDSYILSTAGNISIAQSRDQCCELADSLRNLSIQACSTGNLFRVEHYCLAAMKDDLDERMGSVFWNLSRAIHTATAIGLHKEPQVGSHAGMDELACELRRRLFWNLYSWDIRLARSLGRSPLLNLVGSTTEMPKMQLKTGVDDPEAPELFTERMLQARLARFWSQMDCNGTAGSTGAFEPVQAEENYEKFYRQFLPTLPSAYSLHRDTQFDQHLPMLKRQRQLFHLALFECICVNFKPLLSLDAAQVAALPSYKQALLSHQRVRLARAALALLDSVTTLQALLGRDQSNATHPCSSIIPYVCFEAGALLACLAMPTVSELDDGLEPADRASKQMLQLLDDPLAHLYPYVSRQDHIVAIEEALKNLEVLSGVSMMARAGAKRLTKLLEKARTTIPGSMTARAVDNTEKIPGSAMGSSEMSPMGPHSDTPNPETILSEHTYFGADPSLELHQPSDQYHPQLMGGIILPLESLSDMELLSGLPEMTEFSIWGL